MKTIEIFAPAKINLFLKIIGKRKDGYHAIDSVFEKISLCDRLMIKEAHGNGITIRSNSRYIASLSKDNLVFKTANYLRRTHRINRGVSVYLEKNIPFAAGLGGGSSDAAAAAKGLNRLWKLGMSTQQLIELSKKIGSDVPLFIPHSRFLIGKGRGDEISGIKVASAFKLWHILIVPKLSVSTPYAYFLFDKYFCGKNSHTRGYYSPKKMKLTIPDYSANIITHALLKKDVSLLNYYSYNSFRDIIVKQFPRITRLKKKLETLSRESVHLSGSGPTMFITLSHRKEAERLAKKIRNVATKCRCILVSTYERDRRSKGYNQPREL